GRAERERRPARRRVRRRRLDRERVAGREGPGPRTSRPADRRELSALNDPALVAREYADETGLSARIAAQQSQSGPDAWDVAFGAVAEAEPRTILEVGPGRGEFAERLRRELAAEVV